MVSFSTFKMLIKDIIPITKDILKILLPTMLPSVIPLLPLMAAPILTAASGELVPKATIVNPISKGGSFNIFAIPTAPSIK